METMRVYEVKVTDGITHKAVAVKAISDSFKGALDIADKLKNTFPEFKEEKS